MIKMVRKNRRFKVSDYEIELTAGGGVYQILSNGEYRRRRLVKTDNRNGQTFYYFKMADAKVIEFFRTVTGVLSASVYKGEL
jgi:hypothetical protein